MLAVSAFGEPRPAEFAEPFGAPGTRDELEIYESVTRMTRAFFRAHFAGGGNDHAEVAEIAAEYTFITFSQ